MSDKFNMKSVTTLYFMPGAAFERLSIPLSVIHLHCRVVNANASEKGVTGRSEKYRNDRSMCAYERESCRSNIPILN